jgi:DNA repair photolyase
MPLNKVKTGSNMYQGWIDFTHNHLAGACPHACTYCSTQDLARRFPNLHARYSGPPRLVGKELAVNYGTGKTIFMENCSDLFAGGIDQLVISEILFHCHKYPGNTYVFQTKNPRRAGEFLNQFPPRYFIGTTAETNHSHNYWTYGMAPLPKQRLRELAALAIPGENKFVTIEPIFKFDLGYFVKMLLWPNPGVIYIGADSKKHGLPEPTGEEIGALIKALRESGQKVVLKSNLKRLYAGK